MAIILVVDDDEMDRELERALLESAGHEVLFAQDGETALKMCRERSVELVVTDLAMPDFNGLRFIMDFRKAGYQTPIIALSGKAADQLDLAEDYGANLTLCKPIDGPKLLNGVQMLLNVSALLEKDDHWHGVG
jgi:two-component system chemotaxis response regulator CheY